MVSLRRVDAVELTRLRRVDAERALRSISVHLKLDPTYAPTKDLRTRRWHATTKRGEFEILTTGVKWYDTRARVGGGGAIDLAMHVLRLPFLDAVAYLAREEL